MLAGAAGLALAAAAAPALAGGFALREQSAAGLGQAFAGSAAGAGGLSSMFWNPATITKFEGMQSTKGVTAIIPHSSISPTPLTLGTITAVNRGNTGSSVGTGDIGLDALLSNTANSYQFNDRIWLGITINAPYGLVTKSPSNWAGQVYGRTSKVFSIEATPTIGFKVNDMLSFGFGLRIVHFKTRLTSAAATAPNAPHVELKGDDIAFGYTIGATLTPFAGTEIGLGYRSRVEPNLKGSLTTPAFSAGITGKLVLPDQVTVGLRQRVTDDLSVSLGFEWTSWSLFNRFPVYGTSGPIAGRQATVLAFQYRDGWYASIGAEYRWNPNLTLRAGLAYEKSPVTAAVRSPRLPDSDRIWASIGASYQINQKLSVDVSYSHIFGKKGTINIVPGNPHFAGLPFSATTKGSVDIFSAGLNYRWDDPKVVQGNLPVVRKY